MSARHAQRVQLFEALLQPLPSPSPEGPSTGGSSAPLAEQGRAGGGDGAVGGAERGGTQDELRRLCLEGIPDVPSHLRPRIYASLLSLPPPSSLTSQYSSFVAEISSRISALPPPSPDAAAKQEERYDRLLREIERDVERTFGGLAWFGAPVAGEGEGEGDALWERITMLDEAEKKKARELAKAMRAAKEENAAAAGSPVDGEGPKSPPPALTLDPPPGSPEAEDATSTVDVPPTPTTPTTASSSTFLPPKRPHSRREALLRPLFIYAFLNPGVSYVQGMSYLAAILLYIFSAARPPSPRPASEDGADSAPPPSPALQAEAYTFFALGALLSQLRDLYTPTLDGTSSPRPFSPHARSDSGSGSGGGFALPTGLGATVSRFNALLMTMDPNVAEALERKGVEMGGLVIRWWTTMFANEFTLPDVVRIWDRLLSFYPPEDSHQPAEALSPVLGHLIDMGLAIVLLERQKIVSPFSRLPEILTLLQSPSADVDRLLQTAWDVRERRLGRGTHTHAKRSSVSSDVSSSSPAKGVFGFGKKLWSSASSPSPAPRSSFNPAAPPSDAADYELDDRSSAAGSDYGRPRFGSLAFSSPRSSQDLSGNVTVVDGKVLPPPPARIDQHLHQQQRHGQHETIASLIEQELQAELAAERAGLRSPDEADEYGIEDEEGDEQEGSSPFAKRTASGWSGFKSSLSRFAASDTAANLQKRATNLQIAAANASSTASTRLQTFQSSDAAAALYKAQTNAAAKAQLLREQLAQDAPDRLAKIREAATGAGGRLMATGGSERGSVPGSPSELPFTPPGPHRAGSPLSSPRLGATGSVDMGRTGSNGPKPLLLSSSARKAENRLDEVGSEAPSSRRSSMNWGRSPSASPVASRTPLLSPDTSIPPLSRSPSRGGAHGRSASHFDTPSRIGPSSAGNPASSFRPRSSSVAQNSPAYSLQDEDSPISSARIRDATLRRGGPSSRVREDGSPVPSSARPAQNGRGWQLSDAPIRPKEALQLPPLDLGFNPSEVEESVEPLKKEGLGISEAVEQLGLGRMTLGSGEEQEREAPFSPPQEVVSSPQEQPFSPPQEQPFSPPREEPFNPPTDDAAPAVSPATTRPPRQSSLASSTSSATSPPPPQRTSSLASTDLATSLPASSTASSVTTPPSAPSSTSGPADGDEYAPLSAAPSLSRSKLVRRPPAQRKRTSRSSISTSASVDLTGAEARRVASEFLTRSSSRASSIAASGEEGGAQGAGVGARRSLHRKRASEGGARLSRAEFDENSFLDAYGGEEDGVEELAEGEGK
ncbi:hypothetical protein JCM6882_004158 [Rhodosporidiobolus microsporus]